MSSVCCHTFASGRVEIVLNRPERRNALDREAAKDLDVAVSASLGAPSVMVRGEGGSFCSGGDLADLHRLPVSDLQATMAQIQEALEQLSAAPGIVVAWVDGVALGGGLELALAADLIWMHPRARLRAAQLEMGLVPGWGGLERASQRLGEARARALFLDPRWIDAKEAVALGLADRVLEDLSAARQEAERLAELARDAVAWVKQGGAFDADLFSRLWEGPAHRQAVRRFMAGRPAHGGSASPGHPEKGESDHA